MIQGVKSTQQLHVRTSNNPWWISSMGNMVIIMAIFEALFIAYLTNHRAESHTIDLRSPDGNKLSPFRFKGPNAITSFALSPLLLLLRPDQETGAIFRREVAKASAPLVFIAFSLSIQSLLENFFSVDPTRSFDFNIFTLTTSRVFWEFILQLLPLLGIQSTRNWLLGETLTEFKLLLLLPLGIPSVVLSTIETTQVLGIFSVACSVCQMVGQSWERNQSKHL